MSADWDQSKFDSTLKDYLMAHESSVWPESLNKKAARVAWKALNETPVKERESIAVELSREIEARRKDGSSGKVSIGYVIASKRASKLWPYAKVARTRQALASGRGFDATKLWRSAVRHKFLSMLGGRKASSGFLRVGWISVLQQMASQGVREARTRGPGAKLRGSLKGSVSVASPGKLSVTIQNSAHSLHEKLGGFMRLGEPALQRAFDAETQDMIQYLEGEMRPEADRFNRRQS